VSATAARGPASVTIMRGSYAASLFALLAFAGWSLVERLRLRLEVAPPPRSRARQPPPRALADPRWLIN
jgi:hypothetical protein